MSLSLMSCALEGRRRHRWLAASMVTGLAMCAVGCGEAPQAPEAPATPSTRGAGWTALIEADWTLQAGSEGYVCALRTIEEDLFIQGLSAEAPAGTHHTLLTITEPAGPDRDFECGPGTLSDVMLFASGVDTNDLIFPEGVAMRVPAGKQILLNLHLLNASAQPLSGTSGTWIRTLPAHEVTELAELIFAGPVDFTVPPNASAEATGSCLFRQDATVLSIWPHMHRHGRHMQVVHHEATGNITTLHDAPFDFGEQLNYPIVPTLVQAGEHIDVQCRWDNTSPDTVTFGDSTNDEMCFAGLYRYPASGPGLFCEPPPL